MSPRVLGNRHDRRELAFALMTAQFDDETDEGSNERAELAANIAVAF
jgi:hypothetical protein